MSRNRALMVMVGAFCLPGGIMLTIQGYTDRSASAAPAATAIHSSLITHNALLLGAPVDTGWQVAIADAKTATTGPLNPAAATGTTNITLPRSYQTAFSAITIRARYPSGGTLSTAPVVRVWGLKGTDYQSLKDADGNMEVTLASASTDQDTGSYAYTESSAEIYALGASEIRLTVKTAAVCAAGAVRLEVSRH